MWARRDSDPTYLAEIRRSRPEDNAHTRPYSDMRRDIIAGSFPQLDDASLDDLSRNTVGLVRDEIVESIKLYLAGRPIVQADPKGLCRDPESKEYCERLLDPFEIRQVARAAGLRVSLRPDSHTLLRRFLFREARLLNPLLFRAKPGFVVLAERTA